MYLCGRAAAVSGANDFRYRKYRCLTYEHHLRNGNKRFCHWLYSYFSWINRESHVADTKVNSGESLLSKYK